MFHFARNFLVINPLANPSPLQVLSLSLIAVVRREGECKKEGRPLSPLPSRSSINVILLSRGGEGKRRKKGRGVANDKKRGEKGEALDVREGEIFLSLTLKCQKATTLYSAEKKERLVHIP